MTEEHRDSQAAGSKTVVSFLEKYRLPVIVVLAICVLMLLVSRSPVRKLETHYLTAMDTIVEINFVVPDGIDAEAVKSAIIVEIERLERLLSRTKAASDINRLNSLAGIKPVAVNPDTYRLVEQAYYFAAASNGAFDPTIGPLIDCWGFLGQQYRLPAESEIMDHLWLVDYRKIIFDQTENTIFLPERGMVLEPGGLAKGFILDQVVALLKEYGVSSAFINAGGDIAILGSRPDGEPWRLGIRHPRDPKKIIAAFKVSDGAVVTSGDYKRYFEQGGVVYHHILDPDTGKPARGLSSATILSATAAGADAISTAAFVLGPSDGLRLIEGFQGVEGILITPELEVIISSGLEGIVEIY